MDSHRVDLKLQLFKGSSMPDIQRKEQTIVRGNSGGTGYMLKKSKHNYLEHNA